MNLSLVTPAAAQPVSLADALAHIRGGDAEQGLVSIYLAAAIQAVQDATGRALITETWRYALPEFPCGDIILPRAPLLGVTEARYWSNATTPVDTVVASTVYQVVAPAGPTAPPGRMMLAPGQSWPSPQLDRADALRITFTAGYGATAASVPAPLRAAILLLTGDLYENREAQAARALTENEAVARLLAPYIVWVL